MNAPYRSDDVGIEDAPPGIAKVETGIPGFDFISHGGLPAGRVALISGTAGSGKTIFASHFLAEGIRDGEPGVFVTFEEPAENLRNNLRSFGWNIDDWEAQNRWRFVDASLSPSSESIITGKFDLGALMVRLEHAINQIGARRASLDSLAALFLQFEDPTVVRRELLRVAFALRRLGVTSVMTCERETDNGSLSRFGVEEYVTDSVIILRNALERDQRRRTVEVFKFRGSSHQHGEVPFVIRSGRGIVVLPLAEVALKQSSGDERANSGCAELDRMCGGGFFRDSMILVSGATGAGKTLLATEFAAAGVAAGERTLYFAFEESRPQLHRNAAGWGNDFEAMEESGYLRILAQYPETESLDLHLLRIREQVEQFEPQRLVIDSLSALERVAGGRKFREFLLSVTSFLKERRVTGFMTATTPGLMGGTSVTDAKVSTNTDTILMLRYVEVDSHIRRSIMVLKMRGSAHEKDIREFSIGSSGIEIGDRFPGIQGILSGSPRVVDE